MKKKLFAILLVVALVFSAVAILAACQPGAEYNVIFRSFAGRELFRLTTDGEGKISKADVEANETKYASSINSREPDGYFFDGWFTTVEREDEEHPDKITGYSGLINYNKVYTSDTTYYAGYKYEPTSGEETGYMLIGNINGINGWDWGKTGIIPDDVDVNWKMDQDETEGWIYRAKDVDMKGGDAFKVKTYGLGWDDGEINVGGDNLGEVYAAEGAELEIYNYVLNGELVYGVSGDNAFIDIAVKTINVDVEFNYRTKLFDVIVNSIDVYEVRPEIHYIIVGGFESLGANWDAGTQNSDFFFTENGNTMTLEFDLPANAQWKITRNNGAWDWQLNATNLGEVTGEDDLVVPADAFESIGDNNILTNYECSVVITVDLVNSKINILVKSIVIPDPDFIYWESEGYAVVGVSSWNFPITDTEYLFTQDTENLNIGTLTCSFKEGNEFKVSTNSSWNGRINIGWSDAIVVHDEEGNVVANLLAKNGDNIIVRTDCTLAMTLNVSSKSLSFVVVGEVEVPDVPTEPDRRSWGVVGSAVGSWDNDTLLSTEDDGTHKITGLHLSAGEFKFRAEGAWTYQAGWHNEFLQFVAGDGVDSIDGLFVEVAGGGGYPNIKATRACTVDIELVYITDTNWSLIITVTAIG